MTRSDPDFESSTSSRGGEKPNRRRSTAKTQAVTKLSDDVSIVGEDAERKGQMRALIALARERGYLTHADINDHLSEIVTPAAMETIVSTFNEMGVTIYEQAPDAEALLLRDVAPTATSDDQADEEAEAALSTVDSEFGRTTDPVRMYMREMGSSELLTRAGELMSPNASRVACRI